MLLVVMFITTVLTLGPRGTHHADDAATPRPPLPDSLAAVPAHFAAQEREVPGLVPGTEKQVVLGPRGAEAADWAVVYLHGFSASRQELAPVPQDVARALGAHFFATRLTGHGQGSDAMLDGNVAAWKGDALEALAVGRRLGRRVLVIGVSTGASLATWLASQPEAAEATAWVLVSPNYGLRSTGSELLLAPWGAVLARWIVGPVYSFEPRHPDHARYWTTSYPSAALVPMMTLAHVARQQPMEQWHMPVLMLVSPADQVIDVEAARRAFARIGSTRKSFVEVFDSGDALHHVLAGRILSPGTTDAVTGQIVRWAEGLMSDP